MILYFTGTGNSRYIALQLSKQIHDEVKSINEYFKYQKQSVFYSDKPYVFVLPTYAWRMPRIVMEWIQRASFSGNRKVYVILTCGESVGQADKFARIFFNRKTNLYFQGLQYIVMPENYIVLFHAPKPKESKEIVNQAMPKIKYLAKYIQNEEKFPAISYHFGSVVQSSIVNFPFYHLIVSDKGFYATDKCISCQRCKQLCPLNNITIVHGKPKWNGHCTHCMACICGCPVEAIEYKKATKNKQRYYLSNDYEYSK